LIYFDPTAADPAVFEPILYPVAYEGPGAYGSQWTTTNLLILENQSWFRHGPACGFCSFERVPSTSDPWGVLLYGMRGTVDRVVPSSIIRERSWPDGSAGTGVPVAREHDFRAQAIRFYDVPGERERWRVTLRVWTLDEPRDYVFHTAGGLPVPVPMMKIPDASMWFGSLVVTPHLGVESDVFVRTENAAPQPRAWAMLTFTNNETQQVTIRSSW
jgi:hypothetical protein